MPGSTVRTAAPADLDEARALMIRTVEEDFGPQRLGEGVPPGTHRAPTAVGGWVRRRG